VTVRTSVVLPAYRAWRTLPAVLEALRPQVEQPGRELVVVESSGSAQVDEWPWARVVARAERLLPGAARNLGVEHARGELIAFIDADAVPEPGWLDALEAALTPGVDVVAGAIVNGTTRSIVGTSDYLLEFAEWVPKRRGVLLHGATCNLLVRRETLAHGGGFRTDLHPGEDTVLTFPLGQEGRLAFARDARVVHLNRTRLLDVARHQYQLGSSFVRVCREVEFPRRVFTRFPLTLVAGPLRVPVVWLRLARWRALTPGGVAAMPVAVALGCVWSAGLTAGAVRDLRTPGARN
jgi:Glycosyl transferase family 2